MISFIVTPNPAAVDVVTPITEWPARISILAGHSVIDTIITSYLKCLLQPVGYSNQLMWLHNGHKRPCSVCLKSAVVDSYFWSVSAGHKVVLCRKNRKKSSLRTLP